MKIYISNFCDPWFNLALEECIFREIHYNIILFLWRNHNTVVIGRAQNPWKECNTRRISKDNVKLARRSSGGGAVFHDLGNTCFTFIYNKKIYKNYNFSNNIIIEGLKSFGINAKTSGRNDLTIYTGNEEKKISGSAYKENANRNLHHGTILLNTDIQKLSYYLTPDIKKLKIKGITSVNSRVANLSELCPEINHELLCQALQKSFCRYHNKIVKAEIISLNDTLKLPNFRKQLAMQSCWKWNYGAAPTFTHQLNNRFAWGNIDLYFNIEHGIITKSNIYTDSLFFQPFDILSKILIGTTYEPRNIKQCCQKWINICPNYCNELNELTNWLVYSLT